MLRISVCIENFPLKDTTTLALATRKKTNAHVIASKSTRVCHKLATQLQVWSQSVLERAAETLLIGYPLITDKLHGND